MKQVDESGKPFEETHKFCTEELLVPNLNKCDMVRINMWDNHLPQALVLNHGEFPNVFTNFENQVGEYSTAYSRSDRDWTIVAKLRKNKMVVTYVLVDEDNNVSIKDEFPAERITERYGYRRKRPINKKKKDEVIKKHELMDYSTTYDRQLNFCYGVNLNAVYLSYDNLTYEDGIVISKSAAKKMSSTSVDEVVITLNTNDLLLNLYGNNKYYKCLPDIGEELESPILAARRRINYESILYDLSTKNISTLNYDTDVAFIIGKHSVIYDVEVFCNGDVETLKGYTYYKQILDIMDNNYKYYNKLFKILDKYMDDPDYNCDDEVKSRWNTLHQLLYPNKTFRYDGNTFDNLVIKVKTYNENPLVVGSKITGRYGIK
jgi:DNA-directed RNA polymerase beta subunit